MAVYTFELGFDWNMPPRGAVLGMAYPLQWTLVDDEGNVVSPMKADGLMKGVDSFAFNLFDLTKGGDPSRLNPVCLQVLFKSAVREEVDNAAFEQSPTSKQQITTLLTSEYDDSLSSHAYGEKGGWPVTDPGSVEIENDGRFELWMNLTIEGPQRLDPDAIPRPRYYQVDPEMVVGGGGTGNREVPRGGRK